METVRMLLGFLALSYIGLPLLILFTQKMQARPKFVPIDPSNVPPDVTRYFASVVPELEKDGFRVAASLGMPNQMPNVRVFLVMLINRGAGDKAMVTLMSTDNGSTTLYTEFSTRFDDGQCFDTLNSPTLSSFQAGPQDTKTRVPSVQDVHLLYQIHRWAMSRKRPSGSKITYRDGEAIDYLQRVMIESYDEQVRFGRLKLESAGAGLSAPLPPVVPDAKKLDSGEGVYRPTVKGAYLMTWGLLWPVSWIRKAMMKSQEQATLRAFRAAHGTAMTSF